MSVSPDSMYCPLPDLGVGIIYSTAVEPLLREHPDIFDVIEVEPQTTWINTGNPDKPYRVVDEVLDHIAGLPGAKLVHSVGTPVGGSVRPDPIQVRLLSRTIQRLGAPWASDHLSFNATPEFSTGFFLPPRQTEHGISTAVESIGDLQAGLPVPIAVETGVNYLRPRKDEMPDGAFVGAVAHEADCGILLDLHNVFANSLNGRQTVEEYLSQLPLDRVWEMHLAGGFEFDGYWLDAHSGVIPDALYSLARDVVPCLPNLKAINFEIFPAFVPVVGLDSVRSQIEKLHHLWELRNHREGTLKQRYRRVYGSSEGEQFPSLEWERELGGLVIGETSGESTSHDLAIDPGVRIINRLIGEFRASMVVNVLRLTSRYMMLSLGPDVFRSILADFWSKAPPHQFASAEAREFASYLKALDFQLPQLGKIMEFEQAVLDTLTDDQPRLVVFDSDPLPLLRALAGGRLPDAPGQTGTFEIEVTPDGPVGSTSIDPDSLRQSFPYH